ncbi:hypothetical protein [Clostridium botulinum]|uniref:hypothetical protein n=1 Tax=Clostridium botulinum TaxID=1491 RepID=UPI001969C13D|nr:hypothetical protein [Clostridium botulinum]MBN3402960.1 hypothetical protein [Clostridium botulinum]MBN3447782.1 hypothetical protein [Clostridium botulinum]
MSTFSDTSPILIKKRKGDSTDPFKPIIENLKIINNVAILDEIPNKFRRVNVEGLVEKRTDFYNENNNIDENEYIVDYKYGYVFFNEKMNNKTVEAEYLGTGVVLYPSSRIYDTGREDIIITIQEMINGGREAIEAYASIDNAIKTAEEYYAKISTCVDGIKEISDTLNISIVNAKNIDDILNKTIEEARKINDTLGGTIINGTNKITEIDNIIQELSVCEEYSSEKEYKKLNRVSFKGSSYECIKDCKDILPSNKEYWNCVAEKGKDGKDGEGSGNMHTEKYDKNNDGIVDIAEVANRIEWNNIQNKPDLSQVGKVKSVNTQTGDVLISAIDIKTIDGMTVEKNISNIREKVESNLNKIGNLSTLEKEIIDNLTNENKELNLTNAINYLYKNGGNGESGNNDNDGSIKLGRIENLTAISDIEGTKANLSWQNPTITEFEKVEIYVSTQDLTSANYDYCTKNATKIVDSKIETFEYKAKNNTTYYFKAFAIYNVFGAMQNSDGVITSVKVLDNKPPATVTNIKATTGNGEITLTWINPKDTDFEKIKIVRKENSKPTDIKDGIVVYGGNNITYKDTTVVNDVTYYYRFFTYDTNNNVNDTDIQIINVTPIANGYDKPISDFTAKGGDGEVTLSWIYPSDANFSTVKIIRKENGYPTGINDGDFVCESFYASSSEYSNENMIGSDIDENLTNGVKYYYRAFTFNKNNQYCDIEEGQQVTATPQAFKEYGVRWTKSTDIVERLGDAVGLTAITGGKNDFNNLIPWCSMRRCNLSDDGIVNAYYGNPMYKIDGSNGQCMVEIPKFWFKIYYVSNDIIEFWICDGAKDGYEVHPAFFRDRKHLCDDNSGIAEEVDYRYHHTYLPSLNNDNLESKSSVLPKTYFFMSTARDYTKKRGNGWGLVDFNLRYALQLLYLIEYADFNSQKTIGSGAKCEGINDSYTPCKTGGTNLLGNITGCINNGQISYRGIEDFFGNCYQMIDGFYITDTLEILINNKGFQNEQKEYAFKFGTGFNTKFQQGAIKDIFHDKRLGFVPNNFKGTYSSGLYAQGTYGDRSHLSSGGDNGKYSSVGVFCFNCTNSSGTVGYNIAASLSY